MWKPAKGRGRRWIDEHNGRTVGLRVISGPDIRGEIAGYDGHAVVLAASGTPTPLLVHRDKIVMMYVVHDDGVGAADEGEAPASSSTARPRPLRVAPWQRRPR